MTRILIVKTSSMGDVIHNLPIVTDIQAHVPNAVIDWVVEEAYADLVSLHPGVTRVLPVAWRRWRKSLTSWKTWSEMRDFRYGLQRDTYDYILDTQGLIKSAVIVKLAHGRTKCGFDARVARESWAARAYDAKFVIPRNAHAVERNRWLAGAALEYYPDEHRLDYGLQLPDTPPAGDPFAVCLPSTSRSDKMWPETHWIALGGWLNRQGLSVVMPAGSPAEVRSVSRLAGAMPSARVLPHMRLSHLAAWIRQAAVVIGVDTGLTHLGAALRRPTVGLYVHSDPERCGLYGLRDIVNLGKQDSPPDVETVTQSIVTLLKNAF